MCPRGIYKRQEGLKRNRKSAGASNAPTQLDTIAVEASNAFPRPNSEPIYAVSLSHDSNGWVTHVFKIVDDTVVEHKISKPDAKLLAACDFRKFAGCVATGHYHLLGLDDE